VRGGESTPDECLPASRSEGWVSLTMWGVGGVGGVAQLGPLEQEMSKVHRSANSSARFYLWAGLFLLVFQLTAFIRLTFWELSWDVMEPIGFFVQLGTGIRASPPFPLSVPSASSEAVLGTPLAAAQLHSLSPLHHHLALMLALPPPARLPPGRACASPA
jgi:hypothetical protein